MSTTLEQVEARHAVIKFRGDLSLISTVLDNLAAYENAASLCAAAMTSRGALADDVTAALISVDVASTTRRVIMRAGKKDTAIVRQLLAAAVAACERSEQHCSAHAQKNDHCRLHVAAARDSIRTASALLTDLG